jgi:hypothetical protein
MVPRNSEENERPLFRGDDNAKRAAKIRQAHRQRRAVAQRCMLTQK